MTASATADDGGPRSGPWWRRVVPGAARRAEQRRLQAALGEGVWRRAHDRTRRSVDRYHQVLEGVEADAAPGVGDAVLPALHRTGAEVAGLLEDVRALCVRAQEHAPSTGAEVPRLPPSSGLPEDLHRRLSRAATSIATAAQAATMARVSARDGHLAEALDRARAAARASASARSHVQGAPGAR